MAGVKGRSGGKREGAGRPVGSPNKPKLWADAIRRAVLRQAKGEKTKRLEVLADSLIRAGIAGDVSALREVGDRLDGKPAQALTGEDGGAIEVIAKLTWADKSSEK